MDRRILISGGGGFVGSALSRSLKERGDDVVLLTRGMAGEGRIHWDYAAAELDAEALEGFAAVVHLAGEPIAGLWTKKKKRAILESRRDGTKLLATTLAGLREPPGVLVSASAIGIYGDRGEQTLVESSGVGEGFLAEVVSTWERSAAPAADAGIRVVNLRLGLVLAESGGMMGPIKPQFKAGLGGRFGDGQQWWSWVTLDDVARAFVQAIDDPAMSGAYNVTAPHPVTNAEFTRELAAALKRPAFLPAPKFALRLAARDMADEMLLSSQRVDSGRLAATGFGFNDSQLRPVLDRLYG